MKNIIIIFTIIVSITLISCVKESVDPTNPKNQGNPITGTGSFDYGSGNGGNNGSGACSAIIEFSSYDQYDCELKITSTGETYYLSAWGYESVTITGNSSINVDCYFDLDGIGVYAYYGGAVLADPCGGNATVNVDFY
jgi:hypothetical protein